MIKKFTKNTTYTDYHNAIELAWFFILSEIVEYFILFNAYDTTTHEYNIRRIFWLMVITGFVISISTLFSVTCITYLLKTFGAL
jgi:hypothetical protein